MSDERAKTTADAIGRLRTATKLAVHHLGLLALLRKTRRRQRSLILRYHAVAPDGAAATAYAGPDITIPRRLFAAQMRFLARAYAPVPLAAIVEAIACHQRPPAGAIAITLDDGYADNYHQAFPILRSLGLPATVYVVTETLDGGAPLWMAELRTAVMTSRVQTLAIEIGGGRRFALRLSEERQRAIKELTNMLVPVEAALRRRILGTIRGELGVGNGCSGLVDTMLSSAQVREMHAAGITIGAHTQTHSNMTLIPLEEARTEIAGSRERLQQIVGSPVLDFAFPNTGGRYPHYNETTAAIVRELGFRSGVTSRPGVVATTSNLFLLPRVGISPRLFHEAPLAAALERYRLLGTTLA